MSNATTEEYASSNEIKVNVVKGATKGVDYITWYKMYAQHRIYSKLALGSTTTIISSMIWGSQWDQIMLWMKNVKNEGQNSYYVVNSVGMGNFSINGVDDGYSGINIAATGCFEVNNMIGTI